MSKKVILSFADCPNFGMIIKSKTLKKLWGFNFPTSLYLWGKSNLIFSSRTKHFKRIKMYGFFYYLQHVCFTTAQQVLFRKVEHLVPSIWLIWLHLCRIKMAAFCLSFVFIKVLLFCIPDTPVAGTTRGDNLISCTWATDKCSFYP